MNGKEIVCMISDDGTNRIATGTRDQYIHIWFLDANDGLHPIMHTKLETTVPGAMAFRPNLSKELYVWGIYDGRW
jgi:hypothetical protein